jgi:hypothetical protein
VQNSLEKGLETIQNLQTISRRYQNQNRARNQFLNQELVGKVNKFDIQAFKNTQKQNEYRNSLDPSRGEKYQNQFSRQQNLLRETNKMPSKNSRVTRDPFLDAYQQESSQNTAVDMNMRNSMTASNRQNLNFYESNSEAGYGGHKYGSCYEKLIDPHCSQYPA